VYRFTVHADGYTSANAHFLRETVLTARVWAGGNEPYDPQTGGRADKDGCCETLMCFVKAVAKSHKIQEHLKAMDIDLSALRECLEEHCRESRPSVTLETIPGTIPPFTPAALPATGMTDIPVLPAGKTTPVKRRPKMPSEGGNMFVLPEQAEQLARDRKNKKKNGKRG
jgi:hypothetical protein